MLKNFWNGTTKILVALLGIGIAVLTFMAGRRGLSTELDKQTEKRRDDVKKENEKFDNERETILNQEQSHRADVINHSKKASEISKKGKEKIEKIKNGGKDNSIDDEIEEW